MKKMRTEKDVLGELDVPADAYWGINTQRAIENFQISGLRFSQRFILSLAKVKKACVLSNIESADLDEDLGNAVLQATNELLDEKRFLDQFPIDVFQTGSGTQTNMNMNEVLANRANEILGHPMGMKSPVHPNDHVNKGQSSNDIIPTAMHLAALEAISGDLLPSIETLIHALGRKIEQFEGITKVGRTHLQDAVPIPLSTEFEVYRRQFSEVSKALHSALDELALVPVGGTALGTGLNAPKGFAERVTKHLSDLVGRPIKINPVKAEGIASHSKLVATSGILRQLALACIKMANDIRWMGSGPRAGLGELLLPQNEPGSSIMPGKINPTQAEALIQVSLQVMGNDSTIALAEGFGSMLDLNVAKPVMIVNLLNSIHILFNGIKSFAEHCLEGLRANANHIRMQLERSLMIVTRLTPIIGYDKASEVAKAAHSSGKTIRKTLLDMKLEIDGDLDEILDPKRMV
ncbi:MAG: class II fumarate hydratase [Candidatus Thorarchaeota archaeon]